MTCASVKAMSGLPDSTAKPRRGDCFELVCVCGLARVHLAQTARLNDDAARQLHEGHLDSLIVLAWRHVEIFILGLHCCAKLAQKLIAAMRQVDTALSCTASLVCAFDGTNCFHKPASGFLKLGAIPVPESMVWFGQRGFHCSV